MKVNIPNTISIALISRLLIVFWAIIGFYIFPIQTRQNIDGVEIHDYVEQEAVVVSPENIFVKWDTNHYFNIVNNGYDDKNIEGFNPSWNFLPGYPSVLFLLSLGGLIKSKAALTILGLLFSNITFIWAIHLLTKLMTKLAYEMYIIPTVTLISFYPGSIYYSFLYTESLFLLLFIGGYYFLLNKQKLYAVIIFAIAMLTRKIGVFLPLVYILESIGNYDLKGISGFIKSNLKYLIVMVAPLVLFVIYMYTVSGDFLTLYKSQNEWSNLPPLPFVGIYDMFRDFRFTTVSQISIWAFFLTVLVLSRKKIKSSLWIYSLIALIFITATGQAQGYIRYMSVLFPLFIMLSHLVDKNKNLYLLILYGFITASSVWVIMFVNDFSFAI